MLEKDKGNIDKYKHIAEFTVVILPLKNQNTQYLELVLNGFLHLR